MTHSLPAKAEKEMSYTMANGDEMRLTISMVKNYLVQGKSEYVTDPEAIMFMAECKARRLDPFRKECWLIKYSRTGNAAIVESIHHKRAKARAQADCKGWSKGLILIDKKGQTKRSKGLVLEGETLVGAYFEATPDGWIVPYELEINLTGYIGKTQEGSATAFWKPEKQPSQIMKVVESQGLSALWCGAIGTAYIPEELPEPIDFELSKDGIYEEGQVGHTPEEFDRLVSEKINYPPDPALDKYLKELAAAQTPPMSVEQFKAEGVAQFEELWAHFEAWSKLTPPKDKTGKAKKEEMIIYGGPWDQPKWWKTRKGDGLTSGFAKFVSDNLDTFKDAPVPLQAKAIKKWGGFYPDKPFPVAEVAGPSEKKGDLVDAEFVDPDKPSLAPEFVGLAKARENLGEDVYAQACETVFAVAGEYPDSPDEAKSVEVEMNRIAEGS